MRTASMAVLDYATKYREELLWNRYQAGRNAIKQVPPRSAVCVFHPAAAARSRHGRGDAAPPRVQRRAREPARQGRRARRREVPGRHVGDSDGPGVRRARAPAVRAAGISRSARVSRRSAGAAVRRRRVDAAVPDGRARRSRRASPLSAEFRAALKPVQGKAVDWHTAPDAPFTTNAAAAGIVPPPARISGAGDCLSVDPAQNDAFRLINRALADGGAVQYEDGGARGGRYLVSGVARREGRRLGERALAARRAQGRGRRTARRRCSRASRSTSRGPRAWTKDGSSGCSTNTSSTTRSSPTPTCRPATSARGSTSC